MAEIFLDTHLFTVLKPSLLLAYIYALRNKWAHKLNAQITNFQLCS